MLISSSWSFGFFDWQWAYFSSRVEPLKNVNWFSHSLAKSESTLSPPYVFREYPECADWLFLQVEQYMPSCICCLRESLLPDWVFWSIHSRLRKVRNLNIFASHRWPNVLQKEHSLSRTWPSVLLRTIIPSCISVSPGEHLSSSLVYQLISGYGRIIPVLFGLILLFIAFLEAAQDLKTSFRRSSISILEVLVRDQLIYFMMYLTSFFLHAALMLTDSF